MRSHRGRAARSAACVRSDVKTTITIEVCPDAGVSCVRDAGAEEVSDESLATIAKAGGGLFIGIVGSEAYQEMLRAGFAWVRFLDKDENIAVLEY